MSDDNDLDGAASDSRESDSEATAGSPTGTHATESTAGASGSQPLQPGMTLGRYQIISCLDRGGMGVVYKARHTALGKVVALKVVSMMFQSEPRTMDRFLREMQAIGRLEPHPNVLNAYDAGDEDGVQYIATELIEGIELGKLVSRVGPLSVSEACKIVSQAALALDHLRKHDLVHRDIKPSNLMLTRDGVVKVVDMGLALLRDEQSDRITVMGEAMGSVDYMAPEQWIDSHSVDWRCDVYGLGCTFYCLLAGHPPYGRQRKGSASRMRAHLDLPFPDIRKLRGDVPDGACKLLQGMVTKDPNERIADLAELSSQLDLIAAGDLKALVARGFDVSSDQPLRMGAVRQGGDGSSDRSMSLDAEAVTEPAHVPVRTSEIEIHDPAGRRRVLPALLVVGAVLGLLVLGNSFIGGNGASNESDEMEPVLPSGEAGVGVVSPVDNTLFRDDAIDLDVHQSKVMDMIFLPGAAPRLASVDEDGTLCIVDPLNRDQALQTPPLGRAMAAIDYRSATDELYIVTQNGTLQIRSGTDGTLRSEIQLIRTGGLSCVASIAGASQLVTGDWRGDVRQVDLSSEPISSRVIASRTEVVYDVGVSSDGGLIAWVGRDPLVSLLDVNEQTIIELEGHQGWVYDVAFSAGGKTLVTAGHEGEVRVWNLPSGKFEGEFECIVPQAVEFLPDGRHVAVGGRNREVEIWNVESLKLVQQLPVGQSIDSLAVSQGGEYLAAGASDGTLKVWLMK